MMMEDIIHLIQLKASAETIIDVVWLYGSHAKGNADMHSDYDLAIAFKNTNTNTNTDEMEEYRCDDISYQWSQALEKKISIIDINKVPTPLAYSVIQDGIIVFNNNSLRLNTEESRVWSKWEAYQYEYTQKQL